MKTIQPIKFETPVNAINPKYSDIIVSKYNDDHIVESIEKPISESINNIGTQTSSFEICNSIDKPFGLKFNLFIADIHIYPKFENIFNFITGLF